MSAWTLKRILWSSLVESARFHARPGRTGGVPEAFSRHMARLQETLRTEAYGCRQQLGREGERYGYDEPAGGAPERDGVNRWPRTGAGQQSDRIAAVR